MTSTDDSPVPRYPDLLRLDGRGFVVVGAGQGIGRQACHALAQAGAKVFCIDNVETLAKEAADEVGGVAWWGDARDRGDVERSVERAQRELGRIDGLVDMVGIARYASVLETTDDDYDWTFDVVLRHAYLYSQACGQVMSGAGGGTMVFV